MGKIIKSIVAGVLALSMATWGVPVWGVTIGTDEIPVSVTISAGTITGTISVALYDRTTGSPASSLSFDTTSVSLGSPWVVANEYAVATYTTSLVSGSVYPYWGIIMYTDNLMDYGAAGVEVAENAGGWGSGDEDLVYGGLINTSDAANPAARASLAWQVYDATTSVTAPSATLVDDNSDGDTDYYNESASISVYWYEGDWAYIPDLSNIDYSDYEIDQAAYEADDDDGVYDYSETFGDRRNDVDWTVYTDSDGDGLLDEDGDGSIDDSDYVLNYGLITYHTTFRTTLAYHPATGGAGVERPITQAGDDIYLYLAAKFATVTYDSNIEADMDGYPYVLSSGIYEANITLELFNE